jgi:hypothetical protein
VFLALPLFIGVIIFFPKNPIYSRINVHLEVTVPIYVVREQMCRCLHLQEYTRGVFHDDDGTSTAWVKMNVPPSPTNPETNKKTLYGEPSPSQMDAYRTLDEAIVRYLCEECGVVVKDVNYERVRRLEYSLFRAATYEERLYDMADELKKELAAVEGERRWLAASDSHYTTLFNVSRMVRCRGSSLFRMNRWTTHGHDPQRQPHQARHRRRTRQEKRIAKGEKKVTVI